MKTKEKTSVRNMSVTELTKLVVDTQKKVLELAVGRYTKQVKNTRERTGLRRKIAVALTMRQELELSHE